MQANLIDLISGIRRSCSGRFGIPAQQSRSALLCRQNKTSPHPSPNSLGEGAVLHASVRNAGEVKNISCASTVKNLVPYCLNALLPSRKAAFTLAEVLITLGIIGVVAALTMPSLIAKYQKQVWATQLKKEVNVVENGVKKYLYDEGVDKLTQSPLWVDGEVETLDTDILKRILNLSDMPENSKFSTMLKNYDNPKSMYFNDGSCIGVSGSAVFLDVNCDKGPNKWGSDRFISVLTSRCTDTNYNETSLLLRTIISCSDNRDGLMSIVEEFLKGQYELDDDDDGSMFSYFMFLLVVLDGWKINY